MISQTVSQSTRLDEELSRRALDLALMGTALVSPGPLVGCVIASEEGEIFGEGFYKFEDVNHAETIALNQAGGRAAGATAYVSLEPHAHHGRTAPCTEALIRAGIRRVVAPIEDPNPKVAGKGFVHLRSAGLEVVTGLLADEASRVNEHYLVAVRKNRPFVHLKVASSLDGKIATRTGDSRWITGVSSRLRGQEFRHAVDAILVGSRTAKIDDPMLTDRTGLDRRKPLVRVVLDSTFSISENSALVMSARETPLVIVGNVAKNAGAAESLRTFGVEIVDSSDFNGSIHELLRILSEFEIQSVLIEGGATVAGSFLDSGLIDKATFFIAPYVIGGSAAPGSVSGTGASVISEAERLSRSTFVRHDEDIEITGYTRSGVEAIFGSSQGSQSSE